MISGRAMLVFVPLISVLITIISTAPTPNNELYTEILDDDSTDATITTTESMVYDDDKDTSDESTTVDYNEETISMPKDAATDVLIVNVTELSVIIDDIKKMSDRLFVNTEFELSVVVTTEKPKSSQSSHDDE
ncbi:unnamed protein product [Rotaria sp. Silwood2]|nr:unnamed protein product [Rotaria sp. Silwood2]CAF3167305.1 unnamed protein product [Rotaria sp. Silwood2]CAF3877325.1 unnamed protein product [Rotaria sp. Silwood2]